MSPHRDYLHCSIQHSDSYTELCNGWQPSLLLLNITSIRLDPRFCPEMNDASGATLGVLYDEVLKTRSVSSNCLTIARAILDLILLKHVPWVHHLEVSSHHVIHFCVLCCLCCSTGTPIKKHETHQQTPSNANHTP